MESYLIYIAKAALAAGIFYLVFLFLFRNGKQFVFNRFYLPASLFFSLLIPLISFTTTRYMEAPAEDMSAIPSLGYQALNYLPESPAANTTPLWQYILFGLYFTGIAGFLFQLITGHLGALSILKNSTKTNLFGNRVYVTKSDVHPFSFFNKIVLSEKTLRNENLKIIVAHEKIHVKENHTLDILLTEFFFLLQWVNPFAWLIKGAVKNNLEYKTDHEIIKTNNPVAYQMAMISMAGQKEVAPFLTAMNGSQLKNRIIMMKKKRNNRFSLVKKLVVLPLLAVVTMGLSKKEVVTEYIQHQNRNIPITREIKDDTLRTEKITNKNSAQLDSAAPEMQSEKASVSDTLRFTNEPLYVVDGNITKNIIQIQPDDIERIDVLKEKSATAFYGNKGKNGVVLITTKSKSYQYRDSNAENVRPAPMEKIMLPEEMPEFPGGEEALKQHIANKIRYPESAKEKGIHGRVYVTVTLSKEGKVTNPILSRGIYPPLDKEAIRVVSSLPDWKPGKHHGKPVEVAGYRIPVDFVLTDNLVRIKRIKQSIPFMNPLYVVDGKETEDISDIQADDIKNIEVLDVKSGINLFGQKGKKGVVVITTKLYAEKNQINSELELRKFIANHIKYPIEAAKNNLQKTVDLWAEVEYNGQITHFYEKNPGGKFVPINEIVVVAYSTLKKGTSSGGTTDNSNHSITKENEDTSKLVSLLKNEVKRVSRTLPSIEVPEMKGKIIRLRVKFMLQK